MTQTLDEELTITDVVPYEDEDDGKDHKTHIINPTANTHIWEPGMSSQDVVDIARATGQIITALCGYKFVPKRNPDKYDACQACIRIASEMLRGDS